MARDQLVSGNGQVIGCIVKRFNRYLKAINRDMNGVSSTVVVNLIGKWTLERCKVPIDKWSSIIEVKYSYYKSRDRVLIDVGAYLRRHTRKNVCSQVQEKKVIILDSMYNTH